jgi:hypothetical protein
VSKQRRVVYEYIDIEFAFTASNSTFKSPDESHYCIYFKMTGVLLITRNLTRGIRYWSFVNLVIGFSRANKYNVRENRAPHNLNGVGFPPLSPRPRGCVCVRFLCSPAGRDQGAHAT